jgi:hypothetical protein
VEKQTINLTLSAGKAHNYRFNIYVFGSTFESLFAVSRSTADLSGACSHRQDEKASTENNELTGKLHVVGVV